MRAWPLEWVNGSPLAVDAVMVKAAALTEQLGVDDFSGLRADRWPATTIPALNLVASAYERDPVAGLAVSLELRAALFEHGIDVGDPDVLAFIAANHDLPAPSAEASAAVQRDYDEGKDPRRPGFAALLRRRRRILLSRPGPRSRRAAVI